MAEAKGPPRKTTTYNKFSTMASQNERYNTKQDEFFWLENIMRVAPHKLHSVPGPTGTLDRFPHVVPPVCDDSTLRGQEALTILNYIDQQSSQPDNPRTGWSYVGDNEEIYTLIGKANCAGGNMAYTDVCCQINHWFGPSSLSILPVIDPNPLYPAINIETVAGTADEPFYYVTSSVGSMVFIDRDERVNLDLLSPPFQARPNCYTKHGDFFYGFNCTFGFGDPTKRLVAWSAINGSVVWFNNTSQDPYTIGSAAATDNFIYALYEERALPHKRGIAKFSPANGNLVDTFDLTDISPHFMFSVNDNLMYLLCLTSPVSFYYIEDFTDLIYVGKIPGAFFAPFAGGCGFFKNGAFYMGGGGFAGFTTNIYKIAVPCPPDSGTIIATVSTGSTVAAGASIDVDWADILQPDSTDSIALRPAPTGGDLGFVGAALSGITTGGLDSGTLSFPIPGGTPPGDYIFQLVTANGNVLISTSNVFAVT